jgi:hypothetical protein
MVNQLQKYMSSKLTSLRPDDPTVDPRSCEKCSSFSSARHEEDMAFAEWVHWWFYKRMQWADHLASSPRDPDPMNNDTAVIHVEDSYRLPIANLQVTTILTPSLSTPSLYQQEVDDVEGCFECRSPRYILSQILHSHTQPLFRVVAISILGLLFLQTVLSGYALFNWNSVNSFCEATAPRFIWLLKGLTGLTIIPDILFSIWKPSIIPLCILRVIKIISCFSLNGTIPILFVAEHYIALTCTSRLWMITMVMLISDWLMICIAFIGWFSQCWVHGEPT